MALVSSQIDRIKDKQQKLRELRIKNSWSFKENTQEEFDRYIENLDKDVPCKYSTGIHGIVNICNDTRFQCKYRGELYKSLLQVPKMECKREKMARIEGLLKA